MTVGGVCVFILFSLNYAIGVKNLNVTRTVDLKTHVVRVNHRILASDVKGTYEFVVDPHEADKLAFISATEPGSSPDNGLRITSVTGKPNHFIINFNKKDTYVVNFEVLTVFTNIVQPKPAEMLQADMQYVKYGGSALFYSPYDTEYQQMDALVPGVGLVTHTEAISAVKVDKNRVIYGPFENTPPFSREDIFLHYENPSPFMTVVEMTRLIELSHWGNIAVEESLEIKNMGAKLKGSFSRLDFDYGIGQKTAVVAFKTSLPLSARDIYYRDEIGNISTSSVAELYDSVEVTLMPRFPLMGGWKTRYTLGYNIPAYEYLLHKGSSFSLNMRFIDHIYDEQVVEDFTLKIVLPELVSDVVFTPPYPVVSQSSEVLKTYLDTSGRPVIVIKANRLVNEHIQDFTLTYRFNMLLMLREPLMLIMAFIVLFVMVMVYVRLDFSIYRDEKNELRLRAQALVDQAQGLLKQRSEIYSSYENILLSYKGNKNSAQFTAERRKLDNANKTVTTQLHQVQTEMAELYPDGVEKLNSVSSLDQRYRDLFQENVQLAEKLLSGKLTKPQYQSANDDVNAKKADISYRIESILEGL